MSPAIYHPLDVSPQTRSTLRKESSLQKEFLKDPLPTTPLKKLAQYITQGKCKAIIVMAGAGISTASGIPDFRSPGTGLYYNTNKYGVGKPSDVFDLRYFKKNPRPFLDIIRDFINTDKKPNLAHKFCKELESKGLLLRMYTQNIDGLEKKCGISTQKLVEAHGTLDTSSCVKCSSAHPPGWTKEKIKGKRIPSCQKQRCSGYVKPDVVMFGEDLPSRFYQYPRDFGKCDLLIVMGTSLNVEPFSDLVNAVPKHIPRVLFNRNLVGPFSRRDRPNDMFIPGDITTNIQTLVGLLSWNLDSGERCISTEQEWDNIDNKPVTVKGEEVKSPDVWATARTPPKKPGSQGLSLPNSVIRLPSEHVEQVKKNSELSEKMKSLSLSGGKQSFEKQRSVSAPLFEPFNLKSAISHHYNRKLDSSIVNTTLHSKPSSGSKNNDNDKELLNSKNVDASSNIDANETVKISNKNEKDTRVTEEKSASEQKINSKHISKVVIHNDTLEPNEPDVETKDSTENTEEVIEITIILNDGKSDFAKTTSSEKTESKSNRGDKDSEPSSDLSDSSLLKSSQADAQSLLAFLGEKSPPQKTKPIQSQKWMKSQKRESPILLLNQARLPFTVDTTPKTSSWCRNRVPKNSKKQHGKPSERSEAPSQSSSKSSSEKSSVRSYSTLLNVDTSDVLKTQLRRFMNDRGVTIADSLPEQEKVFCARANITQSERSTRGKLSSVPLGLRIKQDKKELVPAAKQNGRKTGGPRMETRGPGGPRMETRGQRYDGGAARSRRHKSSYTVRQHLPASGASPAQKEKNGRTLNSRPTRSGSSFFHGRKTQK